MSRPGAQSGGGGGAGARRARAAGLGLGWAGLGSSGLCAAQGGECERELPGLFQRGSDLGKVAGARSTARRCAGPGGASRRRRGGRRRPAPAGPGPAIAAARLRSGPGVSPRRRPGGGGGARDGGAGAEPGAHRCPPGRGGRVRRRAAAAPSSRPAARGRRSSGSFLRKAAPRAELPRSGPGAALPRGRCSRLRPGRALSSAAGARGARSESPDFCQTSGFVRAGRGRARLQGRGGEGRGGAASRCGFPQSCTEKGIRFAGTFIFCAG